jgi:hypothetical protein
MMITIRMRKKYGIYVTTNYLDNLLLFIVGFLVILKILILSSLHLIEILQNSYHYYLKIITLFLRIKEY